MEAANKLHISLNMFRDTEMFTKQGVMTMTAIVLIVCFKYVSLYIVLSQTPSRIYTHNKQLPILMVFVQSIKKIFLEKQGYFWQWREMRRVLLYTRGQRDARERIARYTYFYDLTLEFMISFSGLIYVFFFTMKELALRNKWIQFIIRSEDLMNQSTETNHGLKMYYCKPYVRGDPRFRNPTKWKYSLLESRPFWRSNHKDAEIIESNAEVIRKEVNDALRKTDAMLDHPDMRTEVSSGKWSWMSLYGIGGKNETFCKILPRTAKIVESTRLCVPFGFAFVSRIQPQTHIEQHTGSSNLRIRMHLGIEVPKYENGNSGKLFESAIRVGTEKKSWKQDEVMTFDDSFEHEVDYKSGNSRTVLIVDIWHPDMTQAEISIFSEDIFGKFGRMPSTKFVRVKD